MIRLLTRTAFQLDEWLHHRLGRSYRVALSAGLILDIGHRILEAPEHVSKRHSLIGVALAVAMELALLIHQIAEMHTRLGGGGAKAEG